MDRLGKVALLNDYVSSGKYDSPVFTEIVNMIQEEHAALQRAFDLTAEVAR
jgi:hypothetical protein